MRQSPSFVIRLTRVLAIVLGIINAVIVGVDLMSLRRLMVSTSASGAEILWDMTIPWIRIRISCGLILATVLLLTRRTLALLGSIATLCWVIIEYLRWFLVAREMRLASGAIQTGYTFGIERWGFVVFVMSTILLLLVVYTCIIAIRQKDSLD